ncbi:MAG: succinylglutamate-semialdehyde dehydrogenase [Gammaproteobacteria bacterium]|nr:succinylglutamate-semialdehyde dehydrogenase [Gammaproteobacteria bacterium]
MFIDGEWLTGGGDRFDSVNPATGSELWSGYAASAVDVDQAAQAARRAFESWGERPFREREAICKRFAQLLEKNKEALAETISKETGKPLWDSHTEVQAMAKKIEISVRAWHQRTGETELTTSNVRTAIRHKPHGVVAVFGPYNFPAHLPNGHIVPALLAGNTVLFKPSELTPWVAEETVRLWQEAGLPAGVLNLLQGERMTGEAVATHLELDGLFFTGSARVGHLLHQQFAVSPHKILALEMGGNNPLIVGRLREIKPAVYDVIQSAYLTSGQRCTCARRLFVPRRPQGDELLAALAEAVLKIRVGAWNEEPQPFMGPVISNKAARQLMDAQEHLLDLGARPIVSMKQLSRGAAFLSPGLLDVTEVRDLPDEEYFGPLLQVIRHDTLPEAIRLANRTRYGLSAGLLSDRPEDYDVFYRKIRAGIVNWNRQTTGASSAAPFGGVGASGNHRPSAYYAADYCAYPVASMEAPHSELPPHLAPGIEL